MHLAAAAPVIPWSDLAYSLMPNGRTLDYKVTGPTTDLSPIGVEKQSFVSGLFALGAAGGYYSATDQQADLPAWYALLNAGEPYDSNPEAQSIITQIARFHSAYYLLDGAYGTAKQSPAPLLIANGFTDDLFPVDEAVRYYNLERSLYPSDPIALVDGDFGHQRAQNKPGDKALLSSRIQTMFDHYVKGAGATPQLGATATIETCPSTARSGGPFSASTWAGLHPGEVDFSSPASPDDPVGRGQPGDLACDRPDRRRRRLRVGLGDRSGPGRRHVPPAGRDRPRLHAARLADRCRHAQRHRRRSPRSRLACGTSTPRRTPRRSWHAASTASSARRPPGLPASPGRVALRGRPRRQARVARPGRAVRARVQRPVLDRDHRPAAAPPGARCARQLAGRREAAATPVAESARSRLNRLTKTSHRSRCLVVS